MKKKRGQGLIEYALLLAFVALVVAGGLVLTGEGTGSIYEDVATALPNEAEATQQPPSTPLDVEVLVISATGTPIEGVDVLAFDASESQQGSAETNALGLATFSDLDAGRYVFRADYRGQGYWSETVILTQGARVTITIRERQVQVNVIDAQGHSLEGVPVYVFNSDENYIGEQRETDQNGATIFTLPNGEYKFRADYQAQAAWSEVIDARQTTSVDIRLSVSEFTVRVYQRTGGAAANVPVYAFNSDDNYSGISARTDSNGTAIMELPSGVYKFRADYSGADYWSETVSVPNINSTEIYVGGVDVTVQVTDSNGNRIAEKMVYLYSGDGEYLGQGKSTNANGSVIFELNDGSYRFRATDESQDFWSETIDVPNTTNATINIQRSNFTVTVTDRNNRVLSGIGLYVFVYKHHGHDRSYEYTGLFQYSDSNGKASFDLSDGEYIILAYDFSNGHHEWSSRVKIPAQDKVTVRIR